MSIVATRAVDTVIAKFLDFVIFIENSLYIKTYDKFPARKALSKLKIYGNTLWLSNLFGKTNGRSKNQPAK
ncbi:MAG: hypothetical protein CVT49_00915 [candidate division Zixibacteria bacterium HGW-Zixibacteria-1]|nr:MAG: hypothetical protein CVT49_00915 [candidate division Zixibacteria bacterium HGW-Zixibacteria-1]